MSPQLQHLKIRRDGCLQAGCRSNVFFTFFGLHTTVGVGCNLENIMCISQKSELGISRSERNLWNKLKKDAGVG